MKKLLAILLCLCMIFTMVALASCDKDTNDKEDEEIEEEEKDDKDEDDKKKDDEDEDEDDKKKDDEDEDEDDKKKEDEDEDEDDKKKDEVKDEPEYFYGDWEVVMNLGGTLDYIYAMLGIDADFSCFELALTFTFDEDGNYEITADRDAFEESYEETYEVAKDAITELIEAAMEEEETELSFDEYVKENLGTTLEEFLEGTVGAMAETVDAIEGEGTYKFEDGKFWSASEDEEIDEDMYEEYEITDEDEFVVTGSSEDIEDMGMYPMTFTRQ